ncbi:hypothetical protein N9934_00935 [Desulfosarcina sp.]|nr:hypothetical protein [Desulfosarcina sp.]
MKLILKAISSLTLLVTMNIAMAEEISGSDNHHTGNNAPVWFSTTTSALLNRSSSALATNHICRGIRLAHQALQNELLLSDQLIANHNLCVGFLRMGETEMANPYCMRATEYAQLPFNIIRTRGAYFLSEKLDENYTTLRGDSLFQLVLSNIEHQNVNLQLSLVINYEGE